MIVKIILDALNSTPKRRALLTGVIFTLFPGILFPQIHNLPVGTRALGMGAAYVALANNAETIFLNPGGIAQIESRELSVFYQKPFGLEDVNFGSLAFTLPFSNITTGIGLVSLSNGLLNEQTLKLAVGKHIQQKLFYGFAFTYNALHIKNYGNTSNSSIDIGLVIRLHEMARFGFQAQNLNRTNIGKTGQPVPQSIKSGLSFLPAPKLILNLELYKEINFTEEIRFGAEYHLFESLAIRLGTANNPDRFSSGFGLSVKSFLIDYAFFTHNDLGLTHQVALSIKFGKTLPSQKVHSVAPEPVEELTPPPTEPPKKVTPGPVTNEPNPPININTADITALTKLPGIGKKTASAIINFRTKNGNFKKPEDLVLVPGIGKKKLEKILHLITVD